MGASTTELVTVIETIERQYLISLDPMESAADALASVGELRGQVIDRRYVEPDEQDDLIDDGAIRIYR